MRTSPLSEEEECLKNRNRLTMWLHRILETHKVEFIEDSPKVVIQSSNDSLKSEILNNNLCVLKEAGKP